jgi:hypothetical protein
MPLLTKESALSDAASFIESVPWAELFASGMQATPSPFLQVVPIKDVPL